MSCMWVTRLCGLIPSAALCAASEFDRPDFDQYDEPLVVSAAPDSAEPIVLDEAPIVRPIRPENDEASVYEADDALYGDTAPIDDTDECGYPEDEYGSDETETSSDSDGYYEDELTLSTDEFSPEDVSAEAEYSYADDDDEHA